ncbi:MAG TPA: hypothetical protein VIL32_01265 [Steroidobacteraceae bacterium]
MSGEKGDRPPNATVYRVCGSNGEGWHVFDDSSSEPIATFSAKTDALMYAMSLARGHTRPQVLLSARSREIRSALGSARRAVSF